jgi:hypothetical protein
MPKNGHKLLWADSLLLWGAGAEAIATYYGKEHARRKMNYWEIIADDLSKAGFSWGCVSAIDSNGRTIWIVDSQTVGGSLCTQMKS